MRPSRLSAATPPARKVSGFVGASQACANSPTVTFFDKHTRSQGPSLHRHYPASSVSGRRRRARLLSRWPPSAAQTGRAVFPHPAFTKTFSLERQRRRTSRQGRRTRTCSTAAHPPAGGTSEPSLPPVASSHSTSILDRGCPGLSLKELSTSTTLLISSPVPLRPSSPTAFPGTLCRHSLVARLSPHLWYYSVVRRLLEHRFPLRFRL